MRKARLIIVLVAGVSLLLNAVFAGMAVRLWSRADTGAPSAVFFSLPSDLRAELRNSLSSDDSRIGDARSDVQRARPMLQALLSEDDTDPAALQNAMIEVREATEQLQIELHTIILRHYALQATQ